MNKTLPLLTTRIPFSFRKGGPDQCYGIWFRCFGNDYVLPPLPFFQTLLEKNNAWTVYAKRNGNWETCRIYNYRTSNIVEDIDLMIWDVADYTLGKCVSIQFERHDYIDAVTDCLYLFDDYMKHSTEKTAYGDDLDPLLIQTLNQHLDVASFVYTNSYRRKLKDAPPIQSLDFECEHHAYDLLFTLDFGDFVLKDNISDFCTSLSTLRKQLEDAKKIELFSDDSPTVIEMIPLNVLATTKELENGYIYEWDDDIVLLKIIPNEYSKSLPFLGIGRMGQIVQAIYEGLLRMCRWEFPYDDMDGETWDRLDSKTFYNKIKSPLIENLICRRIITNQIVECRQVEVNHILTIKPDSESLCYDDSGAYHGFAKKDELAIYCRLEVWDDMWHVFQMFPLKKSAHAMDCMAHFLLEEL